MQYDGCFSWVELLTWRTVLKCYTSCGFFGVHYCRCLFLHCSLFKKTTFFEPRGIFGCSPSCGCWKKNLCSKVRYPAHVRYRLCCIGAASLTGSLGKWPVPLPAVSSTGFTCYQTEHVIARSQDWVWHLLWQMTRLIIWISLAKKK